VARSRPAAVRGCEASSSHGPRRCGAGRVLLPAPCVSAASLPCARAAAGGSSAQGRRRLCLRTPGSSPTQQPPARGAEAAKSGGWPPWSGEMDRMRARRGGGSGAVTGAATQLGSRDQALGPSTVCEGGTLSRWHGDSGPSGTWCGGGLARAGGDPRF